MANTWTTAERNAFDYLLTATGDAENTTAFLGEYPAAFADETVTYMWTFGIDGGGEPDDVGAGDAYCGMNADATFDGVFASREVAQSYGVTIKNLFPLAEGAVANVYDWRLKSEPRIERAVVKRDPDQTTAGDVRVWRLVIETTCVVRGA